MKLIKIISINLFFEIDYLIIQDLLSNLLGIIKLYKINLKYKNKR